MTLEKTPDKYTCDICRKIVESLNYPNWSRATMRAEKGGFSYNFSLDICSRCLPGDYFEDKIIKKTPPYGMVLKFFDNLYAWVESIKNK